jgi:tetratricopeptide (TPR) repeat protein
MRKWCIFLVMLIGLPPQVGRAEERSSFPQVARDKYERGQDLLKKGQYRDAIAAFEEAMRLGMQDFPRAHLARADSYRKLKDFDTAIAQYTRFIERFGLEESCRY